MIILVRHGQTEINAARQLQGRIDRPLSELGTRQAAALAAALADCGAVRVWSSPLRRAADTAAPIAAALGLTVEIEPRLVELDYGDWDGRPLAEVSAAEWAQWRADTDFAPPGGESLRAVRGRVDAWLRDMLAAAADGPVVAVSHMSPIKAAICAALDADDRATWRMHLDVAAVSRIARRGGSLALVAYNATYPPTAAPGGG